MKEEKILSSIEAEHVCLFCGQQEKRHWEENTPYFDCDCEDVLFNKKIYEQMRDLEKKLRKPKFEVERKWHLVVNKS